MAKSVPISVVDTLVKEPIWQGAIFPLPWL